MKKLLILLSIAGAAFMFDSCDGKNEAPELILVPDKTAISANGVDAVTFTIKYGDETVTGKAGLYNNDTGEELSENSFVAYTAGSYGFYAVYDGLQSEVVLITAEEAVDSKLVLSVNKNTILGDGEDTAIFTVKYDGEDVTSMSQVCTLNGGMCLGSPVFSSTEIGTFEFYATYAETGTTKSNSVSVTVSLPEDEDLTLLADHTLVDPAGNQLITFTARHQHQDITSAVEIVNLTTGETLSGNTYTASGDRKDTFVAVYDGMQSAPLDILREVTDDFYKQIAILRFTGVWCSACYPAGESIKNLVKEVYPGKAIHIAVHGGDDPMKNDQGASMMANLGAGGYYPSISYDFRKLVAGWYSEEYDLECCEVALEYPAECGIALESNISGNTAEVDVTLWSASTQEYFLTVVLMEDGIVADQFTPESTYITGYVHDNVMRAVNSVGYGGEPVGTVAENDQCSRSFSFDLTGYDQSRCHIAAYVMVKTGNGNNKGGTNAAACPINGSSGFRFE